jgi:hypothetical protein
MFQYYILVSVFGVGCQIYPSIFTSSKLLSVLFRLYELSVVDSDVANAGTEAEHHIVTLKKKRLITTSIYILFELLAHSEVSRDS